MSNKEKYSIRIKLAEATSEKQLPMVLEKASEIFDTLIEHGKHFPNHENVEYVINVLNENNNIITKWRLTRQD